MCKYYHVDCDSSACSLEWVIDWLYKHNCTSGITDNGERHAILEGSQIVGILHKPPYAVLQDQKRAYGRLTRKVYDAMGDTERQVHLTQAQLEAIQTAVADVKQRLYLQAMGIAPEEQDKTIQQIQKGIAVVQEFVTSMHTLQRMAGHTSQEIADIQKGILRMVDDTDEE